MVALPSQLPAGFVLCDRHGVAYRPPRICLPCLRDPALPEPNTPKPAPSKRPDGSKHEEALASLLLGVTGLLSFRAWFDAVAQGLPVNRGAAIMQFPWGLALEPRRGFRSDFAVLSVRLLIEVEGQVHSIRGKRAGDVKRRQLAESAGWRVLSLLPEQIHDGSALPLILTALGAPR